MRLATLANPLVRQSMVNHSVCEIFLSGLQSVNEERFKVYHLENQKDFYKISNYDLRKMYSQVVTF